MGFALLTLYWMKPDEVRRWETDKSGVTKIPPSICHHGSGSGLTASTSMLFDPDLVKLTPSLGILKWINSSPSKTHDRYVASIEKWLDSASTKFDWEGPDAEADLEPCFGAHAVREMVKWMKETGWRIEVIAATMGVCTELQ